MVGSPYRVLAFRPSQPAPDARSVIVRRTATRSTIPWAILVITFFLPAVKDCDTVVSPADLVMQSWGWGAWLGPTYFGAGILAACVIHARMWRRSPMNGIAAIPLIAVIGACAFITLFGDTWSWPTAGTVGVGALAIACLRRARRRAGWARFGAIADGWLLGSLPVAGVNLAAGRYWGAFLFSFAFVSLIVLRIIGWAAMFRAKCESESLARRDIRAPSLHG